MIKSNTNIWGKFLIIILLGYFNYSFAQEEKPQEVVVNKNAIYGSVGTFLFLHYTATAYYERIIKLDANFSTFAKVGMGRFLHLGGDGGYSIFQIGLLSGLKNHHLELGAGVGFNWPKFGHGDVILEFPSTRKIGWTANIGWRFQKPQGNFIFRMGASFPEAIYIGVGVPF